MYLILNCRDLLKLRSVLSLFFPSNKEKLHCNPYLLIPNIHLLIYLYIQEKNASCFLIKRITSSQRLFLFHDSSYLRNVLNARFRIFLRDSICCSLLVCCSLQICCSLQLPKLLIFRKNLCIDFWRTERNNGNQSNR